MNVGQCGGEVLLPADAPEQQALLRLDYGFTSESAWRRVSARGEQRQRSCRPILRSSTTRSSSSGGVHCSALVRSKTTTRASVRHFHASGP